MAFGFIAIFWIAPVVVGYSLGKKKGRQGWAWGLLLGWLGVLILACMSPAAAALSGKQREVAELEAELRLVELRKQRAALDAPSF